MMGPPAAIVCHLVRRVLGDCRGRHEDVERLLLTTRPDRAVSRKRVSAGQERIEVRSQSKERIVVRVVVGANEAVRGVERCIEGARKLGPPQLCWGGGGFIRGEARAISRLHKIIDLHP